ncbi:cation:proton antiporter [Nonomuraea sp. K274]|uniref:Cation:proton antiporter n=1 Tax=Nonomuraea cypriaca TaxID=1187855 RepID=A0A931A6W4_9ACTN|nr:cation:proton antiporter [Nonomuraea cypriaca]MBF8184499.1 cation:proton antiporter [Nonomuraea cypriaca]
MTEFQVAILLLDVAVIVLVAKVVGRLAQALGQPAVIGEIIAGIAVGPTLFNGAVASTVFPVEVRPHLTSLADVGLVLFMFLVGLEFDHDRLRGSGRVAGATALGAMLLPFGLGSLLALHLAGNHRTGDLLGFVLFFGAAMSITAFPVLARILVDRGMSRTLIGSIALSAAAVCDLVAWTSLALVQAIVNGVADHWMVFLVAPFAALLFFVVRPWLGRLLRHGDKLTTGHFAIVLACLFASAAVTQLLGLHFVFGAFLFGLAMPRKSADRTRADLTHRIQMGTVLLLPIYFFVAGFKVDLSQMGTTGLAELGLILVTAIVGKFVGGFAGARSQGLSTRQSAVLGTLMNTRGLTELIALGVGLQIGVLNSSLYSLMVVMAVVTTAMSGPLLQWLRGPENRDPIDQDPQNSAAPSIARDGE